MSDFPIRVFPRKTKWTPVDDLAFVGNPPLFRPDDDRPVHISATFTWDMPEAERLREEWGQLYSDVRVGGPAYGSPAGDFVPGMYLKVGPVFTSRGCIRRCPWCTVHKREGDVRELPIRDGWDIADSNVLACSRGHVEAVAEMLSRQPHPAIFSGGLDARLLERWHVDLFDTLRIKFLWFASDTPGSESLLEPVADLLADYSIEKKRCYVLIGFGGETLDAAEKRLRRVFSLRFLPQAMLYCPPDRSQSHSAEWKELQRYWSRPAIYRTAEKRIA
jgi:hypothetical protein